MYYPNNRINRNNLLYGNLKVIANQSFFNLSTQSYDKLSGAIQTSSITSLSAVKNKGSLLSIDNTQSTITNSTVKKDSSKLVSLTSTSNSDVNSNNNRYVLCLVNQNTNSSSNGLKNISQSLNFTQTSSISSIGLKALVTSLSIDNINLVQILGIKKVSLNGNINQTSSVETSGILYEFEVFVKYGLGLISQQTQVNVSVTKNANKSSNVLTVYQINGLGTKHTDSNGLINQSSITNVFGYVATDERVIITYLSVKKLNNRYKANGMLKLSNQSISTLNIIYRNEKELNNENKTIYRRNN